MNLISGGIAVDNQQRIWVVTANRQIKEDEKVDLIVHISDSNSAPVTQVEGNTENTETDMYDLEVFNPEGTLLGKIRLTHFVDGMKIFGDRLFILDKERGMQFYVYKIIDI